MRVLSLGNMGSKVWIIFLAPFKDFENVSSKYQIKIRKHRKILTGPYDANIKQSHVFVIITDRLAK
jgi:hypothetical protein